MDGIEVTRMVKSGERTRHIPVVIMTPLKEEKDVADSYSCGANSYIVKPLDFASLVEVAAQVGFYYLAINRAARDRARLPRKRLHRSARRRLMTDSRMLGYASPKSSGSPT